MLEVHLDLDEPRRLGGVAVDDRLLQLGATLRARVRRLIALRARPFSSPNRRTSLPRHESSSGFRK